MPKPNQASSLQSLIRKSGPARTISLLIDDLDARATDIAHAYKDDEERRVALIRPYTIAIEHLEQAEAAFAEEPPPPPAARPRPPAQESFWSAWMSNLFGR